jgi:hypothetical protein
MWAGLLPGCSAPQDRIASSPGARTAVLPILRDYQGDHPRLARSFAMVIRDQATYHQLPLAEVEVDFGREMLLVVATGGIRLTDSVSRITGVRRTGSVLVADVVQVRRSDGESRDGPRRAGTYHMVVVPFSDLNVVGFDTQVTPGLFDAR